VRDEAQTAPAMASFWRQRLKTAGHTGWQDPKIYGFDQICRLQVFAAWLDSRGLTPGKGLDFGCGVADFSRLLNKRGWEVVGFDKFVTPKYWAPSFRFVRSIADDAFTGAFDLVLSVTVLDHIADNRKFFQTLRRLRDMLRPHGHFFFIEYSPTSPPQRSSYQAMRSMSVWTRAPRGSGAHSHRDNPVLPSR
jgi:2-polyprenyl-3-methyl-5-hydroxy-6-metoxy-1,4-benzoquinol methylase